MGTTRDDKVAQRKTAKFSCTTLRNRLDKAIDQKKDPELSKEILDNFIEAYDKLLKKCDEVAFFDEENSDDEKATMEYKENVLIENDSVLYKFKKYQQEILEEKNTTKDEAKRIEKFEEEKKIYATMMDEMQKELDSIEQKIGEADYPSISLQERWKAAKESKENLSRMFSTIVGQTSNDDMTALRTRYEEKVTRPFTNTQDKVMEVLEKSGVFKSKVSLPRSEVEEGRTERRSGSASSTLKMQKIDFDQFKGDMRGYPNWKTQFKAHISPKYLEEEQILVLKSHLADEVKEDIRNFSKVEEIWEYLDNKYGNSRKIIDMVMNDITKLTKCSDEKQTEIVAFINTIEKASRDLGILKLDDQLNNVILVSQLEKKMSPEMRKEWIKLISEEKKNEFDKGQFPTLLTFLRSIKVRLEYDLEEVRNDEKESSHKSHGVISGVEEGDRTEGRIIKCFYCENEGHTAYRCGVMRRHTVDKRAEVVLSKKLCGRCFFPGHAMRDCRKFEYRVCNKGNCKSKHTFFLH